MSEERDEANHRTEASAASPLADSPPREEGGEGVGVPTGGPGEDRRRAGRRRREHRGRARRAASAPDAAAAAPSRPEPTVEDGRGAAVEPAIELLLDLRWTPPSRTLSRLTTALGKIAADVILILLLPDTPEYASVTPQVSQMLRGRGYATDMARMPNGGQRLRARPRYRGPSERRRPAVTEPPAVAESAQMPVSSGSPPAEAEATKAAEEQREGHPS